jgi:hypothetical protein
VSRTCLLPLTPIDSLPYLLPCWRPHAGTPFALMLANKTRLASRGGRNPTSTGVPVLGGQFKKGGLHQPPFLFCSVVSCFPRVSHVFSKAQGFGHAPLFVLLGVIVEPLQTPFSTKYLATPYGMRAELWPTVESVIGKNERPTGGSAARAWGEWEGTWPEVSSFLHPARGEA